MPDGAAGADSGEDDITIIGEAASGEAAREWLANVGSLVERGWLEEALDGTVSLPGRRR